MFLKWDDVKSKLRQIMDANGMEFEGFSCLRFHFVIQIRFIPLAMVNLQEGLRVKTGTIRTECECKHYRRKYRQSFWVYMEMLNHASTEMN